MNLLNAMAVFVRIVDEGSLAAAAQASGLSPAMVGNHLRSLEDHVGMTLLTRTTRRQSLTEFGRVYYERCLDILERVADADTLAQESQAAPRGRLRVSSPHTFGVDWLMPALAEYAKQYPAVEIDLVVDDRIVDLVEDEFEAAIRIGDLIDDDLIARPLAPFESTLCASPDYLAARDAPRHPDDLATHDFLLYTYGSQLSARTVNYRVTLTGAGGPLCITVPGRIHVNSTAALRQAALSGLGIAILPVPVVAHDLEHDALRAVLPDYAPPRRPLSLVYRRDRRISPKLRSFIDFVAARFGSVDS